MSEKPCHICGLEEGHFVCSQAPVNDENNRLVRSNKALLETAIRLHKKIFLHFPGEGREDLCEDCKAIAQAEKSC